MPDWQENDDTPESEWSEWRGLASGAVWGLAAAIVIAWLSCSLASYAPHMILNFWLRMAFGFLCAALLFSVVHWAAGMAGPACTAIVVVLTLAVLLSHSVIFALEGVTTRSGVVSGWEWLRPEALAIVNISSAIGIVFAVLLYREGGSIASNIVDVLSARIR